MSYPKFTKEMVKTHTILIPSMADIHFRLFERALIGCGYKVEVLKNKSEACCNEGLKYVHNDTCYPATLVIGQFIDALNNRERTDDVALLITQTGGGCRASNYLHLLRKALIKAGYPHVPVLSLNMSNLEKDSGLVIDLKMIRKICAALIYGDMLMYLYNKTRSYELEPNASKNLVDKWIQNISNDIDANKGIKFFQMKKRLNEIAKDFANLKVSKAKKIKVGIVGEIYVKYAALGNNDLEDFLISQDCEIMVPGILGFGFYCIYNSLYDINLYGGKKTKKILPSLLIKYLELLEGLMIKAIKKNTEIVPMQPFKHTKEMSNGVIDHGVKMGEGWLLTAEMVELTQIGYENIVCAQPFGCLPNHICGKGVMKQIKELYPQSNIVAIDYDPSATKVNQENRIKLMLAIAKERL